MPKDVKTFLGNIENNKEDFTLNIFLDAGFELSAAYGLLSGLFERGAIKETETVGHYCVCAGIEEIESIVNEIASKDIEKYSDPFILGKVNVIIRLQNYSGVGFSLEVLSDSTPADIINSIDYEKYEDFDHLFLDPFDMLSFDRETHILDENHSSFILENGEESIPLDFETPLCLIKEFRDIHYSGVIPTFTVSIACVYND